MGLCCAYLPTYTCLPIPAYLPTCLPAFLPVWLSVCGHVINDTQLSAVLMVLLRVFILLGSSLTATWCWCSITLFIVYCIDSVSLIMWLVLFCLALYCLIFYIVQVIRWVSLYCLTCILAVVKQQLCYACGLCVAGGGRGGWRGDWFRPRQCLEAVTENKTWFHV